MTGQLSLRQRMLGDDAVASCLATRRELQRFLDGETDPAATARVARHLDACRACGLQARTYRDIKASLRSGGTPPPADALDRLAAFTATMTPPTP